MSIERTRIYFAFLVVGLATVSGAACSPSLPERASVASPPINRPTAVLPLDTPSPAPRPTPTPIPAEEKSPISALSPTSSPENSPQPALAYNDAPLPDGLRITYITQDTLYLWEGGQTFQLLTLPDISHPSLSTDGQWIVFQQYQPEGSPPCCAFEVWAIRSDGSDLHRLLSLADPDALAVNDHLNFLDQIAWVPGRHELVFSTQHEIDGPPGILPTLDLYLLDITGQVSPLVEPGRGGWYFVPAPTGRYAVLVHGSRISRVDLQSGEYISLLEFNPVGTGTDFPFLPSVVWDPDGRFVMTWIPPENLYRYDYNDEPVQLWRLFMSGTAEQIYRRPAFQPTTFNLSPDLRYLLYLDHGCVDGMGMLHVRDLTTGEEQPRYCVAGLPRWAADSRHFFFRNGNIWQIGNVLDTSTQAAGILDPKQMRWIDGRHFLLNLRGRGTCTLTVATLQGVIAEIVSAETEDCPDVGFSLPEQ